MKSNFAKMSDKTFFAIVVWLTTILTLGRDLDGAMKIIIATAVTLLFLSLIKMKKQPANYSILKEFAFLSKDETHKLIAKKLEERYDVEIFDDFISVNNTSLFIKLRDEKVNLSEVVETTAKSKITGRKKVIFLCPQGYTVGASEAASRSDVTVKFWGEKETFDFLNAFGALVDRPKIKPNKKRKFFTFIQNALAKDKIKGYLVTAFLMLIMLRIYGLSIYYVAITVICIALATACVIKSRT